MARALRRTTINGMIDKMIDYSERAEIAKNEATAITDSYVRLVGKDTSPRHRYSTVSEAEIAASQDRQFKVKVASNQMYDRLATRQAAVLTAIVGLVQIDEIVVKDDIQEGARSAYKWHETR